MSSDAIAVEAMEISPSNPFAKDFEVLSERKDEIKSLLPEDKNEIQTFLGPRTPSTRTQNEVEGPSTDWNSSLSRNALVPLNNRSK